MPTNPEKSDAIAKAHAYNVRILVDGDELQLPFGIQSGRDYAIGEPLTAVAKRLADSIADGQPCVGACDTVEVLIREMPDKNCTGDYDPIDLAAAVSYVW